MLKLCDFGSAKVLTRGEPNIAYICSRYAAHPRATVRASEWRMRSAEHRIALCAIMAEGLASRGKQLSWVPKVYHTYSACECTRAYAWVCHSGAAGRPLLRLWPVGLSVAILSARWRGNVRYYSAPELIFGATDYHTTIDVWSFGCVFAVTLISHNPNRRLSSLSFHPRQHTAGVLRESALTATIVTPEEQCTRCNPSDCPRRSCCSAIRSSPENPMSIRSDCPAVTISDQPTDAKLSWGLVLLRSSAPVYPVESRLLAAARDCRLAQLDRTD